MRLIINFCLLSKNVSLETRRSGKGKSSVDMQRSRYLHHPYEKIYKFKPSPELSNNILYLKKVLSDLTLVILQN